MLCLNANIQVHGDAAPPVPTFLPVFLATCTKCYPPPPSPHGQVVPGELTIVTGVPNSGKSEWIDALLCNLTDQHGWAFAMCSMEKRVSGALMLGVGSLAV